MSIYDGTPLQAAFDALAPTPEMWANASEWAQWYAIDAFGSSYWTLDEPFVMDYEWSNTAGSDWWVGAEYIDIPLGIDWRLCKWSREVTA